MKRLDARRWAMASMALVAAVVATGCGGGSDEGSGGSTQAGAELTRLNVGIVGIAPDASMYLGMEKGFFADEGLEIVPKISGGGAAVIPGVVSGELQIGSSNPVSIILAAEKGLPLKVIANQNEAPASVDDKEHIISGVLVPKDSAIKEPADLAGKTIAVNTLQNIGDVTIKGALDKQGVPVDGIEFIEVPFPDMLAALDAGRVDAAWVLDPFLTLGTKAGNRMILANFVETAARLPLTAYFTSEQYAGEHADVIEGFQRAMAASSEYANEHPGEVRNIVTTFTEIPPEAASAMALPVFTTELSAPALETLGELMVRFGLVEETPDLQALFGTS